MTCDVGSTIDIKVSLTRNVEENIVRESRRVFAYLDGKVTIKTATKLVSRGQDGDKATITAVAKDAAEKFPLNLVVTVNGDVTTIAGGGNNNRMSGKVSIPAS